MSVRRKTNNRITLFRDCFICGKKITTTADTPFVRQISNVNGKKQANVYFCSFDCKMKSYKHVFDGKADKRRKEKESERSSEKNKKYYMLHSEKEKKRQKKNYWKNVEESRKNLKYQREKRKLLNGE